MAEKVKVVVLVVIGLAFFVRLDSGVAVVVVWGVAACCWLVGGRGGEG